MAELLIEQKLLDKKVDAEGLKGSISQLHTEYQMLENKSESGTMGVVEALLEDQEDYAARYFYGYEIYDRASYEM